MEPRPVAGGRGARGIDTARSEAGPAGLHLRTEQLADPARARSALAGAALAACLVGLLGVEGGVIWVVGGVWTLRFLVGDEPGIAWGIACAGAAMRWGAMSIGDVEVATRLLGPSVLSGSPAVRIGITLALVAALCSESAVDGLRARTTPQHAAAVAAIVALVPLFVLRGGTDLAVPRWLIASAVLAAVVCAGSRYARLVPRWVPPVLAATGVVVATLGR